MSMQSMHDFLGAVVADPAVASGLGAALGEKSGTEAVEAVAAYAASRGYDVTPADAETVRAQFAAPLEADGTLSDDDLSSVAGGSLISFLNGSAFKDLFKQIKDLERQNGIGGRTGEVIVEGDLFSKW